MEKTNSLQEWIDSGKLNELMNQFDRFDKFYKDHCESCNSKQCMGVYDKYWRKNCEYYKKEINQ